MGIPDFSDVIDATPDEPLENQDFGGRQESSEAEPNEVDEAISEIVGDDGEEEDVQSAKPPKDDSSGSREKPWTQKTLPADKYVEMTVDGKTEVLPLQEALSSGMRERAFYQRLNELDVVKKKAVELGKRATEREARVRQSVRDLFSDPDELYEFLYDHHEEALEKVARKFAAQYSEWAKNPGTRERLRLERERQRIAAYKERLEREREQEVMSAREREAADEATRRLEPGYREGMKAAGFPKVTPEFRNLVQGILDAHRRGGEEIGADHVKNAIIRAAKLLGDAVKEAPPQAAAPSQLTEQAKGGKPREKRSFDSLTSSEKARSDDFWLR